VKGDIMKRQIGWWLEISHAFFKVTWKANMMKKHWLVEAVQVLLIGQSVKNHFYNLKKSMIKIILNSITFILLIQKWRNDHCAHPLIKCFPMVPRM
jgi:hypothetical protein